VGRALNEAAQAIEGAFAAAGIANMPEAAHSQFHAYLELLLRWNRQLSLTAVREPAEIIQRHFVECAFAARHIPPGTATLLDYGSGAGLPGIPFAICRPDIKVTLAEAHGRKASFLREAVRVLGISGEVLDGRVEAIPESRRFSAVSMRAVEKMELAIPVASERVEKYLILFTTVRLAATYQELAPGLKWAEGIDLPNAEQRILAIGERV
jgi:16S rRNA (guanine527-N7)-methyltransferase